jgi:hypothetical protein
VCRKCGKRSGPRATRKDSPYRSGLIDLYSDKLKRVAPALKAMTITMSSVADGIAANLSYSSAPIENK